jgi:DNA adenine methylase
VASVPQRSPFRYPGGKTWLVPIIRDWFRALKAKPKLLVEPFAGGAIVGLTVAFEELASRVLLVEIDEDVGSVWQTILSNDCEWLARRIVDFQLTEETARATLEDPAPSTRERAFKTIVRNRTLHGGILAPGSRFIRAGEAGRGITSRWYPATLARRIRDIGRIRDRIAFSCGDGIPVIREHAENEDAVFFIDPPYTAGGKQAGKRLYVHYSLDHESLFTTAGAIKGDFLMTYDKANEIEVLALRHEFVTRAIAMKNTHHAVLSELLVGRDLEWVD